MMSFKTFFSSIGDFFKKNYPKILKAETTAVTIAETADPAATTFLQVPLAAQALATSITGDVMDAVKSANPSSTAITLSGDVINDVKSLIALFEAHPEAPGSTATRPPSA